jgi:hypothetical protein
MRKMKNILKTALIIAAFSLPLQALEVSSVVIVGRTVDIDLSPVTGIKDEDLSEKRIKLLGAETVNIYHSFGYTAAVVESIVLRKDGVLEIHLNEGKIKGITVRGVKGETREEVRAFLEPEIGKVFNRGSIRRRIRSIRSLIDLRSISIDPKRSGDGDVVLIVNARKRKGRFYGGVGADMIYGVSPKIGYWYPGESFGLDTEVVAGIKDGEVRRLEGGIEYFTRGQGLLFGINGGKRIERWESRDLEYYRMRSAVEAGGIFMFGSLNIRAYFGFDYERLEDYPHSDDLMRPSVNLEFNYNNYSRLLNKREAANTRIKSSGGWENINNRYFFSGSIGGSYPFFVIPSMRLAPRFLVSYISSDERCLWSYVFDNNMIGIFNDYTASKWKNVAGLDAEFEISRSFVFIGPLINTAYYLNEEDEWDKKTGTGIKAVLYYGAIRFKIIYGWDIDEGAGKGGIFFIVEGGF